MSSSASAALIGMAFQPAAWCEIVDAVLAKGRAAMRIHDPVCWQAAAPLSAGLCVEAQAAGLWPEWLDQLDKTMPAKPRSKAQARGSRSLLDAQAHRPALKSAT